MAYNRFDKNQAIEDITVLAAETALPDIEPDSNIQKILKEASNMSLVQKLDPVRLAEYATVLSSYVYYLNRVENELKYKITWLESNINHIVGSQLDNYSGYGYQEKSSKIKASEAAAISYESDRHRNQTKLEYLNNLTFSLRLIIDNLKNLAMTKSRQGKD